MFIEFYSNTIKSNKINDIRLSGETSPGLNNGKYRPLIFNTSNTIDDLFISYGNIYRTIIIKPYLDINLFNKISFIDDGVSDRNNTNIGQNLLITTGYYLKFKYKKCYLKYALGNPTLSTATPNFLFNDFIGIGFESRNIQADITFPHYSDWIITDKKGFDIPYSININFI